MHLNQVVKEPARCLAISDSRWLFSTFAAGEFPAELHSHPDAQVSLDRFTGRVFRRCRPVEKDLSSNRNVVTVNNDSVSRNFGTFTGPLDGWWIVNADGFCGDE